MLQAGSCGAKAISLDTTAGRRNLTLPDYVKLLRTTRPGLSCAITDEVTRQIEACDLLLGVVAHRKWLVLCAGAMLRVSNPAWQGAQQDTAAAR